MPTPISPTPSFDANATSELEFPNYSAAGFTENSGNKNTSDGVTHPIYKKSANEDLVRKAAAQYLESGTSSGDVPAKEATGDLHSQLIEATTLTTGLLSLRKVLCLKEDQYNDQFGKDDIQLKQAHTIFYSKNDVKQYLKCCYSESVVVIEGCRRDQDKSNGLYLNDMFKAQVEKIGIKLDIKFLIQDTITLDNIKPFYDRHPNLYIDLMSTEEFDDFMKNTVNGRSSKRILEIYDKKAVKANIYAETVVLETGSLSIDKTMHDVEHHD